MRREGKGNEAVVVVNLYEEVKRIIKEYLGELIDYRSLVKARHDMSDKSWRKLMLFLSGRQMNFTMLPEDLSRFFENVLKRTGNGDLWQLFRRLPGSDCTIDSELISKTGVFGDVASIGRIGSNSNLALLIYLNEKNISYLEFNRRFESIAASFLPPMLSEQIVSVREGQLVVDLTRICELTSGFFESLET